MLYGACVDACVFEEYFRGAKAIGIELDAEAYSIVEFVVRALCKKPNLSLSLVLLKEITEMGWIPSMVRILVLLGFVICEAWEYGTGIEA